jgi:Tfp pilus assembly protein PilF
MERRLTAISVTAAVTKRSPCWPLVAGGLSVFVMVAGVALWQEQIVAAYAVELTDEEEVHLARHGTENVAAHDAYLQGWAHYNLQTPEDLAKAVPFFEEAIRLDPNYAQAHAALASVYWDAYQNDWAFDLDMPSFRAESRANKHLEEALKAPTPLAYVLQSRMFVSLGFPGEAVVEAEKAVALDRNDATAHAGLADALIKADRPAEGLNYIEQAMRLDPHHPPSYLIVHGNALFGMENFEAAAANFERAVKRNPDNELPLIYLASSYGHLGRIKDADDAIEAANDRRAELGMGDLTLGRKSPSSSTRRTFRHSRADMAVQSDHASGIGCGKYLVGGRGCSGDRCCSSKVFTRSGGSIHRYKPSGCTERAANTGCHPSHLLPVDGLSPGEIHRREAHGGR